MQPQLPAESVASFPESLPTRAVRAASRVLPLGAIAVVLAASTHRLFELDRFFVPKELSLHLTALVAGALVLRALRRTRAAWVDGVLIAYLILSGISAVAATNPWLAFRAIAVSSSGIVLFFAARTVSQAGLGRRVITGVSVGVVLAAVTSLLQAYGVPLEVFSVNRSPGGTLGNRNFVAHAAAFGFPLVLFATLHARRVAGVLAGSTGAAVVVASLVLTRSRAAWLAFAMMALVFLVAFVAAPALRRDGRTWRRLALVICFALAGVAAALLVPNTLRWRSETPYLDSVQGVVNYREGSGRGRLIQYEQSLRMAATRPLFGVGPGNWPVEYPDHAARRDPSLDASQPGTTFNPWPSSDWIAFVSERGFLAATLLLVVLARIALSGIHRLASGVSAEEALAGAALLATVIATAIVGLFDAVLLLALPTVFVWTALGALYVPPHAREGSFLRTLTAVLLLLASAAGAVRSGAQLVAMEIFTSRDDRSSLEQAARIDPGNYALRLRLARISGRKTRCEHALAARALFPHASAAKAAARRCE